MYFFLMQLIVAVSLNYGLVSFHNVNYLDTNQGQITSPGYPNKYPNNLKYTWEIRIGHGLTDVNFTIHDMDIPCNDILKIEEVKPTVYTPFNWCGEFQERTVYARGTQIRISFISHNTHYARGFNLSWTAIKPRGRVVSLTTKLTTITTRSASRTKLTITPTTTFPTAKTMKTIPKTSSIRTKMTAYSMKTKIDSLAKTRPTPLTKHFATTFKSRSRSSESKEKTKLTTNVSPYITMIQPPASNPIIQKSTTLDITFKYDATNVTILEFQSSSVFPTNTPPTTVESIGYMIIMIIGICVFEALLIIIAVIIVKRFRSRASKNRIPRQGPAGTDGLVTLSSDKGADIAYEMMPLEYILPSNVNKNVEDVYIECPDNVYDSTSIRRPHVLRQNNIYQTNEGIYNASFAKRDRDNNDSNLYQSCD